MSVSERIPVQMEVRSINMTPVNRFLLCSKLCSLQTFGRPQK